LSVQREDRKKSTRLALRRVAVQLFKEQGFVETTVEQIAAQAGVSTRTFFNYFATKDEAVMLPYDDLSLLLRDEIKRRPVREAPYDSARHAAHAAFTFLAADDDLVGLLLDSARLVWEDEMTQAFGERGLTIEPLAARVHAAVAVAATRAGVFSWAEGESSSQHSLAAAIDAAFEALESGGHRET
jgi:AcrR family transcriptional regulator